MNLTLGNKLQKLWIVVVLVCSCAAQTGGSSSSAAIESDDLRLGDRAILASLVVGSSAEGKSLCSDKPVACMGPYRTELAISLIGARSTPASLKALARLIRYRLDEAYYEQYGEEIAAKRKKIKPYLAGLSPKELHDTCHKDVSSFIRANSSALKAVSEEDVCRTEKEITDTLRILMADGSGE